MDKRAVLGLVILGAVAIAGFAILYQGNQKNTTPLNFSAENVYLNFRNGTPSQIFLVDSNATFGTFAADHIDPWDWRNGSKGSKDADRGDRFIGINGTIRNDYDLRLYIAIDAHVYDKNGNQIGTLLRSSNRPEFDAAWMGLDAGDSGSFQLLFKSDKRYTPEDVGRYEVFLAWQPNPTPIP